MRGQKKTWSRNGFSSSARSVANGAKSAVVDRMIQLSLNGSVGKALGFRTLRWRRRASEDLFAPLWQASSRAYQVKVSVPRSNSSQLIFADAARATEPSACVCTEVEQLAGQGLAVPHPRILSSLLKNLPSGDCFNSKLPTTSVMAPTSASSLATSWLNCVMSSSDGDSASQVPYFGVNFSVSLSISAFSSTPAGHFKSPAARIC